MGKEILDYVLVPAGLAVMIVYHLWLLRQIIRRPSTTVLGVNAVNRRLWVRAMMEDTAKNGVLAVQTLRNNIMASTLLATMSITLSSVMAVLMSRGGGPHLSTSDNNNNNSNKKLGFSIKFFSIQVCFLIAFLMHVQSIRYYSHASMLINVPSDIGRGKGVVGPGFEDRVTVEYVCGTVNRGSYFWSLGLRAFYFSFPLFLWIFGPIPMVSCCVLLVFLLYFLDFILDSRCTFSSVRRGDRAREEGQNRNLGGEGEESSMEKEILDYVLVPVGLTVMVAYHLWLLRQIIRRPSTTVLGINAASRRLWVRAMMEDTAKNGILAVQTLRNNIMASTLLATMAIMLSSVIAVLMSGGGAPGVASSGPHRPVYEDKNNRLGFSMKFFSIQVCFLGAFLLLVQSIRYYSHASMLINVPNNMDKSKNKNIGFCKDRVTVEYVCGTVNRASHFWSLGLRAFYFSFPLFLWIFGPVPMFSCSVLLVFLLHFLDFVVEDRGLGEEGQK
ncbi:hypothetical protein STAS_09593, partial [Striga asiatica]